MRVLTLTEAVAAKFLADRRSGDAAADRVASGIIADVRRRGDAALFSWCRKLDGARLTPKSMWIRRREMDAASVQVSADLVKALKHAIRNIRRVAEQQLPRPWSMEVEPGVRVSQRVTPLDTIGCYVPGGRFSLVSTLLMSVVPAQVAGVRRIVAVCPRPNAALLTAAKLLGITEFARIGGAQAVAALAYGTKSVPRVDKIFGPGNRYVTAAKRLISSECTVDMLAGPTEVLIVAQKGTARYIASDILAQAEHDPDAVALFVTTSQKLAADVRDCVAEELSTLPPTNLARRALMDNGAILIAPNVDAAVRFANQFAAEHLSVPDADPALLRKLTSAGSIFVGPWSAQSVGDYASGTNHVLPTSGGARARGGLSTWDFVRCTTVQRLSRKGLESVAPVVCELAQAEGLVAHRRAVEVRR
jgi:histidinol dehydrogenase